MMGRERVREKCSFSDYSSGEEGEIVYRDITFQKFQTRVALEYWFVIECIISFHRQRNYYWIIFHSDVALLFI